MVQFPLALNWHHWSVRLVGHTVLICWYMLICFKCLDEAWIPNQLCCYLCRNQALISLSSCELHPQTVRWFMQKLFEETLQGYEKANAKVETCQDSSGFITFIALIWLKTTKIELKGPSESRTVEMPAFRRFGASVKLRRSFMNQCSSLRRAVEVMNHISPGYVSSSDLMFENVWN